MFAYLLKKILKTTESSYTFIKLYTIRFNSFSGYKGYNFWHTTYKL